jgi:hypothetical protein
MPDADAGGDMLLWMMMGRAAVPAWGGRLQYGVSHEGALINPAGGKLGWAGLAGMGHGMGLGGAVCVCTAACEYESLLPV